MSKHSHIVSNRYGPIVRPDTFFVSYAKQNSRINSNGGNGHKRKRNSFIDFSAGCNYAGVDCLRAASISRIARIRQGEKLPRRPRFIGAENERGGSPFMHVALLAKNSESIK